MNNNLPLTVKRSIELLGLMAVVTVVVIGRDIIMPVLMAFFVTIMLLPIYRFLKRKKFPETMAIVLPILVVALFVALIVWFFSNQVGTLVNDFPEIKKNVAQHLKALSTWISHITPYSTSEQINFIDQKSQDLLNMGTKLVGGFALTLSGIFIFLGLLPIYIYLMLFYKDILLRFTFMWFKAEHHPKVKDAIFQTESIIKSYLGGLLIQISYMTILLGGILLLLGIKHAILIGVIFAFLNLIPYVGALIGNLIGVLLTLASSQEMFPVIEVLAVIAFVQFLDNNILMPRIVGSKVKINALLAILGVFIGGSIAGVAGMFLALPLIAVLKIIFDRTEMFKPWGVLFGDERPEKNPMSFPKFRRKRRVDIKKGTEME
ncbi:MAG: AI-2E family transporter [Pedobacter sp.]|nr:AI-2E family transporter [Pedobacter sp.]